MKMFTANVRDCTVFLLIIYTVPSVLQCYEPWGEKKKKVKMYAEQYYLVN